jgi:hypothetical protein
MTLTPGFNLKSPIALVLIPESSIVASLGPKLFLSFNSGFNVGKLTLRSNRLEFLSLPGF